MLLAELIRLSLTIDNFKYIYVLNHCSNFYDPKFSLIIEFSTKQVKDEFLKKKHKLREMKQLRHLAIAISDINVKNKVCVW